MMVLATVLAVMAGSVVYAGTQASPTVACNNSLYTKGMIGSVSYLTGGVGQDERICLQPVEKDYNLKLVFAVRSGQYLASPMITIQDQSGKDILHMRADGPWFLAKLPAGEYKVIVSREGHRTEIEHVKVEQGLHATEFLWKS